MISRTYLIFALLVYALLGKLLWQLHHYSARDYRPPGAGPDIQLQLNWLKQTLRQDAGPATQAWYPEGYFFMHAIYGSALVNQALLNPDDQALVRRNVEEIEWVLRQLESEAGRAPFPKQQAVEYGVFYQGWHNRLLGGFLLLQPEAERPPERVAQFHRQTEALAQALAQSPTYHLEAYPGGCWPVDNIVALTSLRMHDELYETDYGEVVSHWLAYTQAHLDPTTGLLPHRIVAETGEIAQGARGSSLVLALTFLPELDTEFAQVQYIRFRTLYAQSLLDFVLMREYPHGRSGPEDVDSGPLVAGLGPVATGVSLATARANGDEEIFERVMQLGELLGLPLTFGSKKSYSLGLLPVGDAFLVWGKTVTSWSSSPSSPGLRNYPRLTSPWYPWTSGIALLLAGGVTLPLALKYRSRKQFAVRA